MSSLTSAGSIHFPEDSPLNELKKCCYRKEWMVCDRKILAGTKAINNHPDHYTHPVAHSKIRIINLAQGKVSFRYQDDRINLALGFIFHSEGIT